MINQRRKILVVTQTEPTAQNHGALMRLQTTLDALGDLGPIDLAVLGEKPSTTFSDISPAVARIKRFPVERHLGPRQRARWLLSPKMPLEVIATSFADSRREFETWADSSYALIWILRTTVYSIMEPILPSGPVVVDIDDLEATKRRQRLNLTRHADHAKSLGLRVRTVLAEMQARLDARSWAAHDRRVVSRCSTALVCSPKDLDSLKSVRIEVVPNSYPKPIVEQGFKKTSDLPTIIMPGSFSYAPNVDAAEYFIDSVLPLIRRRLPEVQVRLVGRTSPRVDELGSVRGVTVAGFVVDIDKELAEADLIVVPIRYGGGTRIKILEAFAHGIPVVSTQVGAHGLSVRTGHQLLIADDPEGFSQACVSLLLDDRLRYEIVNRAHEHYLLSYTRESIFSKIRGVALGHWCGDAGPDLSRVTN